MEEDIALGSDVVVVIVLQRPNWVFAIHRNKVHSARWRTVQPGEHGHFQQLEGNKDLLNAAMYAWNGQQNFVSTLDELQASSGGWGCGFSI